ncbi:TonB-dependent siderophore receptor [Horticoccus sp. 23ND18S-11]|uniref:TonB-dependent siderophore receptor n=1 Tax=Horticoccus sp. 23ND18S-11 TaxID=3391832 RepID=UPI0039C9C237
MITPTRSCLRAAVLVAVAHAAALAQSATPPAEKGKDPVQLTPFLVSTEGDDGYRAANTLSGTRMNTSLFHTPAAISVLTKEFLDDIGAENVGDMLKFAMSSDSERTDSSGGLGQAWDVRATIRGFTESVITRDYLPNMVQNRGILANDRFNVDRADVSRGPNSILYGASRPGGAFNLNSKRAVLNGRQKSAQFTVGRFAKKRSEADFAFPIIKDKLALRTNAMWEDRGGWWESEMLKAKGLAVAVTYQPFKHTQVRAGVERMIREQVTGGSFPHADFGYSRWVKGGAPLGGNPLPGTNPAPTLLRTINTLQVVYAPQVRAQPFRLSTTGADMRPDLAGTQAPGFWETISAGAAPSGGTVDDPFYGQVIPATAYLAGPGRSTNNDYTLASAFIDQRVGPVNIELGYARTTYFRGFTQPNANAVGDPNPVLPGAYFADGDSVIAAGRLPGTLLPDIARTNPFAGLPYVQSQAVRQLFDQRSETWRATVGYELDLSRRRAWLGRHSLAAAWQKERSYFGNGNIAEFNLAPGNSQPIDSATNTILRRTYLEFNKPGGARGGLDAWANPIPESPGMKAGFVFNNLYPWVAQKNTSGMLALQSRWAGDRVVLTGGYRRDRAEVMDANAGGERLPNSTNAWLVRPYRFEGATLTSNTGATKTLGAVVTALPWLGLSYNRSQSVFPQGAFKDIFAQVLPPIEGDGQDYGVRLMLLGGRLSANVNLYRADGANQFQPALNAPKNNISTASNAVLTTLRARGQPLPASVTAAGITLLNSESQARDASDLAGRGSEIEITGRLAPGWSITLNVARNQLKQANILSDSMAFLSSVKADWEKSTARLDDTPAVVATFVRTRDATPQRDFVTNPATFADVYAYSLSVADPFLRGTGKSPFAHVEHTSNAFTSYRFANDAPWFVRGVRAGLGANYRGPAVIGYDAANGDAVIPGRSAITWSGMLGKRFALPRGQSLDLQLNVENLFGQEDRLPYSATAPGVIVRYLLPRVRHSWTLRATYGF